MNKTTSFKIYQVDAFASGVFSGNPAAVVPLDEWLDDAVMQAIAMENKLSETAFFVQDGDSYGLRWFTPASEVPLCGHATLASAYVVFTILDPEGTTVKFETKSGMLVVRRNSDESMTMDFPKLLPVTADVPDLLVKGLKETPAGLFKTESDRNYYAVFESEEKIRSIQPDLMLIERLHPYGVVITAKGDEADFVSRYFAPGYGIPEDPVTGSIHCALVPYWADKLDKKELHARQLSKRGGDLWCHEEQDRVLITGKAAKYLEGEIFV